PAELSPPKETKRKLDYRLTSGISQSEFRRLIVTVLCVYLPLSLIPVVVFLRVVQLTFHKYFSFSPFHGPTWKFIVFHSLPKAQWQAWIGIFLVIASFALIGPTRNARRFHEECIGWVYDHLP